MVVLGWQTLIYGVRGKKRKKEKKKKRLFSLLPLSLTAPFSLPPLFALLQHKLFPVFLTPLFREEIRQNCAEL